MTDSEPGTDRGPFELPKLKWYEPFVLAAILIMVAIATVFLKIREWLYGF